MENIYTHEHKKNSFVNLILLDLINRKYNLFGLASAFLSALIDFLFNTDNLGSIAAIIVSFGIGVFSILKARESWLKDRDNRLHEKRLREDLAYRKAFLKLK